MASIVSVNSRSTSFLAWCSIMYQNHDSRVHEDIVHIICGSVLSSGYPPIYDRSTASCLSKDIVHVECSISSCFPMVRGMSNALCTVFLAGQLQF